MVCTFTFQVYLVGTHRKHAQFVKRSHVFLAKKWKWIQRYKPKKIARKMKRISGFIIDETLIKIGSAHIWIWVAIELKSREILALFQLINPKKETCSLLSDLFQVWSRFMESIQYQQMVEPGLQVLKCRSLCPLLSGEKSNRENDAVH